MIKLKEGFSGQRVLSLPESMLADYSNDAIIGNLYISKIGFLPKAMYHYVDKPEGTSYCMVIYCVGGRGHCIVDDTEYVVEKDSFIFIPSGCPYSFYADGKNPWTIYFMHFRGRLASHFTSVRSGSVVPGNTSRLQDRMKLFDEIYYCYSMAYIKEYMAYTSLCLYQYLGSFIYLKQYRSFAAPSPHKEFPFAARVIHYMTENVHKMLTLDELAEHFSYSPSHFSTLFQKDTGVSPINYFIRLKVQKACQYIELTGMRINEIAIRLGYDEPAYFSRLFSKVMGMSPSAYRAHNSCGTALTERQRAVEQI